MRGLLAAFVVLSFTRSTVCAAQSADSLRDEFARSLSNAAFAARSDLRLSQLGTARRIARAYSQKWSDSFLLRQLDAFEKSTRLSQQRRVLSDSLRRAGNSALQTDGVAKAMILWHASRSAAEASGDPYVIAPAFLSVGAGFYRMDKFDSASVYLHRAESAGRRVGDNRTVGNAIGILASVRKDEGLLNVAESMYRRASRIRLLSGDTRGLAADANNLGALAEQRGELDAAITAYEKALAINRSEKRDAEAALNLDNIAKICATRGDYARAESLFREAIRLVQKSGARAESGFLLHGLGRTYMGRGDYERAEAILSEAMRVHDSSGAVSDAIEVRADLAAVKTAIGDPEAAGALLSSASDLAKRAAAAPDIRAFVELSQGDLASEFGTFATAESHYQRAVSLYRSAGDSSGVGQALEGSALLWHERGNPDSASSLMKRASRLYGSEGDRRSASLSNLLLAEMQIAQGDFTGARKTAAIAHSNLGAIGDIVGEAAASAIDADALRLSGRVHDAVTTYRRGLSRLGNRKASEVRWRLHTGLGQALRRSGDNRASADEFRKAIQVSETRAANVRLEDRRAGLNASKWTAYAELALVEIERGRIAEAFALSEKVRARQLSEMLARGRIQSTTESVVAQDLRRKIAQLTRVLESGEMRSQLVREPGFTTEGIRETRAELNRAQIEYEAYLLKQRENTRSYAHTVMAPTRSWKEISRRLSPRQVMIEYLVTDSTTIAFTITADTVDAIDLGVPRETLVDLVEFARRTIEHRSGSQSQGLWRVPMRKLYRTLIQPIEKKGYLRNRTTLLIAPHAELHFLSFAALLAPDNRFLLDRFDVAYTPSATVWAQISDRPVHAMPSSIIALAPRTRELPGTLTEVSAIRRIYGKSAQIKIDGAATPAALSTALPTVGIVHFATYGVLNKHNPLFSFIELAGDGKRDGHLNVSEVFGLPMTGQLIILSACQTAVGAGGLTDVPAGDDWVGLVQAFLQAGARGVVASLWPVDDRATAALMTLFHQERIRGASPAVAIARAQRQLKQKPETADPFYWAAFGMSGRTE